jgi:hypothetical protein
MMPLLRNKTIFLLAAAFVALVSGPLDAQQLAGRAHAAGSEVPVSAAAIVLVNDAGVIVAGTLSATDGQYALRAPAPGHYRVRARRIGFAPDSTELTLAAGSTKFDPALTPLRTSLAVVRIEGIQKCEVERETGDAAYQLWDAAQNALASTIAAADDKRFVYRLERFVREIDPALNRAVYGSTIRSRSRASEPYRSVSPDSLATVGFARVEGDSSVYYAPDAHTLTAEEFIRTHCLRAVRDSARSDQLGLAFEPIRRTNVVDVSGVLWIDRASSELRDLVYHYELPRLTRGRNRIPAGGNAAKGHIEYRQLDNGAWIVNRWIIQVPVQGDLPNYSVNGHTSSTVHANMMWEVGGEVVGVLQPGDSSATLDELGGAIDGTLVAGPDRVPVHGAEMSLRSRDGLSMGESKWTRADGSFSFDTLAPGDYVLRAVNMVFDTVITFPPIPVSVHAGARQTLMIAMPLPQEGREELCGHGDPSRIILHGSVTDSVGGRSVTGARVSLTWMNVGSDSTPTDMHESETRTDRYGTYRFCDLAPAARVIVTAISDSLKVTQVAPFGFRQGGTYMMNLALSPPAVRATITGGSANGAEYSVTLKPSFDLSVYAPLIAARVKGRIGSVLRDFHLFTIYGISDEAVAQLVKMPEVQSVKKREP